MDDRGPPMRGRCAPRSMASSVLTSHPSYWHGPPVGRCHAGSAAIRTFSWLPENYGILHDASWCPRTRRCGGTVTVFCPIALRFQIYPISIRLRLDNA